MTSAEVLAQSDRKTRSLSTMLYHQDPNYARRLDLDRRSEAARRRLPVDPAELEGVVLAAASHNSWAWSTLVERFGALVKGVARRHGLGAHDVDDVAQMTWMRLFEHIDDVREPEAVGGWLAITARHESLRVLRRRNRDRTHEDELVVLDEVEPINERRLIAAERRSALQSSVERLPESQRKLMEMLLAEPAPNYAQISETLGIPQGSIGPTRQRGLARLRKDKTLMELCKDEPSCVEPMCVGTRG